MIMKKTVLNLLPLRNRTALHEYLAIRLKLPSYYGRNLDALYECVSEIPEETEITVLLPSYADPYCRKTAGVLQDASGENEKLKVTILYE